MKFLSILLAGVSAGPVGPSALMLVGTEDTWWPVNSCDANSACQAWKIAKKPGWSGSSAKNLRCDTNPDSWFFGQCVCKTNFMDANNDPWDGCELGYDEDVCYFGSCEDHGVGNMETCGGYTNLNCMGSCCECFPGALTVDGSGCINLVPTVCPFDEIVNNGVCVPDCQDGWSWNRGDGKCEPVCKDGEYYDETVYDRGCIPTCDEGQELSFEFEKPECRTKCKRNQAFEPHVPGEHDSRRRRRHVMPGPQDDRICVTKCPEEYFFCPESGEEAAYCAYTAKCENRLCPDLFKYNPLSAKCEFQCELDTSHNFTGFDVEYDSSFGYCIPKCPQGEEYNPDGYEDGCTPICDRDDNYLTTDDRGNYVCEWCEDDHVYDPVAMECVFDCPEGTDYYEYIPACLPHCEESNETTIFYNTELERCTEKCPFGQVLRTSWIDDANFVDTCYDECTLMTFWDDSTQSCIEDCTIPYEWNADIMECEIKCPNGLYKDEEGNHVPSKFSEGQGACIPVCDEGFMFDRYVDALYCIEECNWRNETFDETTMGCRKRCKRNHGYNYETEMCELECPEGYEATPVPGEDEEKDMEGRMSGPHMRCSPICKVYEKLNKIKNKCQNICPDWLNYNTATGNCSMTCPDKYYFNPPDECVPQCKKDDSCKPEICRTEVDADAVCGMSDDKKSFLDAERDCSAKGGALWAPKSSDDLDYLIDLGTDMWIGIEFNGDDWIYSDTERPIKNDVTAWKYDEVPIPSKSGYYCVKHEKKGTWKEYNCEKEKYYMCRVEGVDCSSVEDGKVEVDCDGSRPKPECDRQVDADAVCAKSDSKKTQAEAKRACKAKGGNLWSPKTSEDHDYLSQFNDDLWIGIEHDGEKWIFTDDNSAVMDFSTWKYGEEPDFKESKTCVKKEKKGTYKEYDCEKEKHYICKFDRYDCVNELPTFTDGMMENEECEIPDDSCDDEEDENDDEDDDEDDDQVTAEEPCKVHDKMTPAEAADVCAEGGGKLWTPRTLADVNYIKSLDHETWLGIMWDGDKWAYMDTNEAVHDTIHNWKNGQAPNFQSGKECVKREKKGGWKEDPCDHEHNFICQYPGVDCAGARLAKETCDDKPPVDCGDGSVFSAELNDCVPDCGENHVFSIKHLKCVSRCPEGEVWGPNVEKCREKCNEGAHYDKDEDMCIQDCGKGMTYQDGQCADVDECITGGTVRVPADGICTTAYSDAAAEVAGRICSGKGGSLIAPKTQADFDYIQSLEGETWLGIMMNDDGSLVFTDTGDAIDDALTNWKDGHPTGASKDNHRCVKREKKGTWKIDDCLHSHDYICTVPEIDCTGLPEPTDGFYVIDQERESEICGKDNQCTNTDGGFECSCGPGMAWSDKREWCVPEFCQMLDAAGIDNHWSIKNRNCTARCPGGSYYHFLIWDY